MLRAVLAVIAGYAIWTALWLLGNLAIAQVWPEVADPEFTSLPQPALIAALALSFVCSLVAGLLAAKVHAGKPVLVMSILLLVTGIAVQSGVWDRMPLWYHLVFLVAIVPLCLVGGRLAGKAR